MSRLKIGIVMGKLEQPRLVQGFDLLSAEHDLSYFAIESPNLLLSLNPTGKVFLFEDIKDMPGYMRGLEEQLTEYDLLIGVESSRLPTFQMVRAASKYNIPCIVLVTEFSPYLYAQHPNIRAIQVDVLEHAQHFLAYSNASSGMLKVEGVSPNKITQEKPYVDFNRFSYSNKSRQRFRDYVGIKPEDILMLYHGPIEASLKIDEALAALRCITVSYPEYQESLKILYVGAGQFTRELKYRCFDYGLAKNVLFLHQDPEPLLTDIYCASDIRIIPSYWQDDISMFSQSISALESTACGVIPIFEKHSILHEYLGDLGHELQQFDFDSIGKAVKPILDDRLLFEKSRTRCSTELRNKFDADHWPKVLNYLVNTCRKSDSGVTKIQLGDRHENAYRKAINANNLPLAITLVDQQLNDGSLSIKDKSKFLSAKGEVLFSLGRFDESVQCFELSLQADEDNYNAYRGLGYLALKGHSHEDALNFFKKSLARCENDSESILGIGLVYRRLSLHEDALFWFERGITLAPNSSKTLSALIQSSLECKRVEKAIHVLERVMESHRDSANLMMTLGQLKVKSGDVETGNAIIREAFELQKSKEEINKGSSTKAS